MDYIGYWTSRAEFPAKQLLSWLELGTSKFHSWKNRYGKVASFVEHYNHVRLHFAVGYITPSAKLAGLEQVIFAARDRKLEEARERRGQTRRALRVVAG